MKKLLSLVLALVMALSLTVPAFADGKTMITEVNLTVGKTYTDLDIGVSVSVPDEADYTASYGGMEFVVGSDVYFYQITGGDANRWLKGGVPCETTPDVSNADKVFAVINLFTKDWQTHEFAINDGLTVTCNGRTINHKAQAASEEGWFSVGGISHQVLIDITPSKTSGTTTITANVAKPELVYEIVIPQAVTMNEAGVVPIGEAKIDITGDKLKNATEKTVISYTASGTNFKLSTDDSKTMTATYYSAYTDKDTNTVLDSTKAIEVYKNSALVNPLTKLYVGVSQTDWDTAATTNPGTYTATVTYNFKAEEVEKKFETVGEVLATVEGGFPDDANQWEGDYEDGYDPPSAYKSESNILSVGCEYRAWIIDTKPVSESQTTPGDYVVVHEEYNESFRAYFAWTITFHMTDNVLTSIDAKLDYYANSTGEKTQDLTTYNYTNIKPFVGEPK